MLLNFATHISNFLRSQQRGSCFVESSACLIMHFVDNRMTGTMIIDVVTVTFGFSISYLFLSVSLAQRNLHRVRVCEFGDAEGTVRMLT